MKLLLTLLATLFYTSVVYADQNPAPTSAGTTTFTTFSASTTSAKILARNTNRAYLFIQNQGGDSVVIKAASTITGTEGIILPPWTSYEPHPALVDSFNAKSLSGTQTILMIEGIK